MIKKFISDLKREFAGYNGRKFSKDLMAGLTVAAVALPLALAFGVSSGADAASGLITAIVAGIFIGLLSGASYQISGPTGAMSAILITLSAKYGIQGVLTAGLLSGVLLLIMAALKIGKLVSYIPAPVITGFTSGIAIIIALGQIDNFFGTVSKGENAIAKLISYGNLGFSPNWWAVGFGLLVVLIMVVYPKKISAYFPSSLMAIIIAVIANFILNPDAAASNVTEVGSIPQKLITDQSLLLNGIDFAHITDLLMPALSIAVLGMIESLLCGAAAGKMKGEKMDSTRELIAQGIGNVLIPLFGGVPATAAIARTSVVIKSGGQTRLASVIHSVTLILSMFLLGGVMSRIPLSALAGVLMVTAFRMNEWAVIKQLFQKRLKHSILQFVITMIATVVFDLTVAIVIGVVVAMLLFVLKSCELKIALSDIDEKKLGNTDESMHHNIKMVYLTGPLFFGTQEQLTKALRDVGKLKGIIFSMRGVPSIDDSAINELDELLQEFRAQDTAVLFCGVQPQVLHTMERAGFTEKAGQDCFLWDAVTAIQKLDQDLNIIPIPVPSAQ
ncbi:MAG: SulP family inorganic anion transporter [Clostridiales bacterium]|nr:SulP family inorganic anion transporter [Clostridiales bacterium]